MPIRTGPKHLGEAENGEGGVAKVCSSSQSAVVALPPTRSDSTSIFGVHGNLVRVSICLQSTNKTARNMRLNEEKEHEQRACST